jgi:hypothetical protein
MHKRTLGTDGPKAEDLREIDRSASQIVIEGARYPEQLEKITGR